MEYLAYAEPLRSAVCQWQRRLLCEKQCCFGEKFPSEATSMQTLSPIIWSTVCISMCSKRDMSQQCWRHWCLESSKLQSNSRTTNWYVL